MTMKVRYRRGTVDGGPLPPRAVLVGCDFPLCESGLVIPVNLKARDEQCIEAAEQFLAKHAFGPKVSGYVSLGQPLNRHYCKKHTSFGLGRNGLN